MILGFVGVGNMGEAILRGALLSKSVLPDQIIAYDINSAKLDSLSKELGIKSARSIQSLSEEANIILLAVKPNVCGDLLLKNAKALDGKALVSIVAGWSAIQLRQLLLPTTRVLRVMPNTPAMTGEGMSVFEAHDTLTDEEHAFATKLFTAVGSVMSVPEHLMHAVTAVSGSGPAYVYMFIEALADGGVREGLPRDQAYKLAAQTVLGAAKMVLQTGEHPGKLKDNVCSPGGTTIEAVAALEENGLRNAVLQAVQACANKSSQLNK